MWHQIKEMLWNFVDNLIEACLTVLTVVGAVGILLGVVLMLWWGLS